MSKEVKNGIMIGITVVLILGVVYLTTAIFMTGEIGGQKETTKSTTTKETSSQSQFKNMIIAGKTFGMNNDNYMVLFFFEKELSDELKSAIISYDSADKDVKLYKVNVDEAINAYVKGDAFNAGATNAKDLMIKDVTLVTIKNNKITSFVDDETQIINKLK